MDRRLLVRVAAVEPITIEGEWQRHCSPRWSAYSGSPAGGRWGRPGAYPVIYLGRPTPSVLVEAYRHLVDGVEGMTGDKVAPRLLHACRVRVERVLDLRVARNRNIVGLSLEDLQNDDRAACQDVAHAAHQLGLHGISAPAATRLGETLALFRRHLQPDELPVPMGEPVRWECLPPDPRILRVVGESEISDAARGPA